MSSFLKLGLSVPGVGLRSLTSWSATFTPALSVGATQRRRSFSSFNEFAARPPRSLASDRAHLRIARARMKEFIASDAVNASAAPSASIPVPDPKGPLNQPPAMTTNFEGDPCSRHLLRGVHSEHAHVDLAFLSGLNPVGGFMPDGRHALSKAAEALTAKRVPKLYQRVRGSNPRAILRSWPAGQAFTSNPKVALKFAETHPETAQRQFGKGVVFVLDSLGMHDGIVDHRRLPKEGSIPAEDQFTVFGHIPTERIVGAYIPAEKDDQAPSVLQESGVKWKPNPNYRPPRPDGKAP